MARLKTEFSNVLSEFHNSAGMRKIFEGSITIEHYKSLMKQIAHQARENPQLQALATVYFRGYQRDIIQTFYKHAASEIGHDQLALNDVSACGGDISNAKFENPLPNTTAVTAFAFYQIYNLTPVGYLGYLFFLEFMPTSNGGDYINFLLKIGVPENALSFIKDHSTIDVGHNRLMERYVEKLIRNEDEFNSVVYAMKVTAHLYAQMVEGAFNHVDNPKQYGFSSEELKFKE